MKLNKVQKEIKSKLRPAFNNDMAQIRITVAYFISEMNYEFKDVYKTIISLLEEEIEAINQTNVMKGEI